MKHIIAGITWTFWIGGIAIGSMDGCPDRQPPFPPTGENDECLTCGQLYVAMEEWCAFYGFGRPIGTCDPEPAHSQCPVSSYLCANFQESPVSISGEWH